MLSVTICREPQAVCLRTSPFGLDQQRFLCISHEAAIKMAARLDLCAIQDVLPAEEVDDLKTLLLRVSVMTSAMIAGSKP